MRRFSRALPGHAVARCFLLAAFLVTSAVADEVADTNKLFRDGQLSEALSQADGFLARHPQDAKMRFLKGLILTRQNRTADAIALFTKLAEDFPESPEPYNNLAVLYEASGQYEKARAALQAAIRIDPKYATAQKNLIDINEKLARQASLKALPDQVAGPVIVTPAEVGRERQPGPQSSPTPNTGRAVKTVEGTGGYKVKRGESLGGIARKLKPDGVSLDQMLVALYRVNPGAFVEDNMHRLRAGNILSVPTADMAGDISVTKTRAIVSAHTADFRQYQRKLAGAAANTVAQQSTGATQREAGGKIQFEIEEQPQAAVKSADRLRLSTSNTGGDSDYASGTVADAEDWIAMGKALEEANSHVRQLEKNISDLQKLLQIKGNIPAELEGRVEARSAQSVTAAISAAASLAPKADAVPRNRNSGKRAAIAEGPEPATASMRTHALWLSLCGVLLTGLSVFVFYSARIPRPGVRSARSPPDRRTHRNDRRTYRNRLDDK
jgi:FimV-like protein